MKPRRRTRAGHQALVRRHRPRHREAVDTGAVGEPGWVSATVLFTDTSRAGETTAWLEPDGRLDRTCGAIQY
jgi:hypothetical protein